ncbi:hypothetical protein FRX31_012994 [Thalictrum thalictroides]|uniref:FBD domain-containing protein n=1 Tax=Thalictrum thalictroides TaxID=46969 RepID=A0A7J6WJ58_THATH|nr:hypothetical protein FRX31_012994 [Thalictrum thalictroides]
MPTSVKLPLLKTLHLESFCFHGNQFIQELLLGSPFLENISIINCGLHGSHNLTISTTQLKYLEIDNIYACIGCCGSVTRVSRDQHFKNCKVEISAPMLTAFKCRAQISDKYLIHDLSSLATADIDMDIPKRSCYCVKKKLLFTLRQLIEFGETMMKFIQALHNATSLKLGTAFLLGVLRKAIGLRPTSYSAKYLKVRTSLSRDSMLATTHLLENSCNLEKLSIEISNKKLRYYSTIEAELPTECRLDQLRFVEISNIHGSENELEFLALLLNKAIILEKLIIVCQKPLYWDNNKKWLKTFIETLRTFQIVSSRAMILLQVKHSNTRLIIQPKEQIKKLGSKVIIGKGSEIVVWDTFMKEVTWVAIDPSMWETLTSEKVSYNSLQENSVKKDDEEPRFYIGSFRETEEKKV